MGAHPNDKKKASTLRAMVKAGKPLSMDQDAWLSQYEAEHSKAPTPRPNMPLPGERNRSASERITYTEERAAAEGNHVHPDSYAHMVRAEGLRADTLLRIVADALVRVNDQYYRMSEHLLARLTVVETAHVEMLEAVRESYLARTKAEAAAIAAEATADGGDAEFLQLLRLGMEHKRLQGQADAKAPRKRKKPLGEVP